MKAHTVDEVVAMICELSESVPLPQKLSKNISGSNFEASGTAAMNTKIGMSLHIVATVVTSVACFTPRRTSATIIHTSTEPHITDTVFVPFANTGKK